MSPISTFLNGGTVTNLRGLAFLSLSETGYYHRFSGTSDSGGGRTRGTSTGSTIPCRVDPLTGGERIAGGKLDDRSTHLITLPPESDLTHLDQFVIDSRGTFEITAIRERTAEPMRFVEAIEL